MKVAIITNYWKDSQGGGIKTYLTNLVEGLMNEDGMQVSVLFEEGNDHESFHIRGNKFLFSIQTFFKLINIKPDVVHSHGPWYCLLPGAIYRKLFDSKLFHTFHTEPTEEERLNSIAKGFMQFLVNSADCVTFVSLRLKERIETIWDLRFRNTAITYAGVRINEISYDEINHFREKFGIDRDSIILLAQGMTAHPAKAQGLKLLIQALQQLREKYPNIKIKLIASREGYYVNDTMEFTCRIGMDDVVIFTGDLENPFVPLKICDIYTHISLAEGLPLSMLEAMIFGKPIIATNVGGIPEAIEDGKNGILIDPDVSQIVNAIDYLLINRELSDALGKRARICANSKFTVERCVKKVLDIYLRPYSINETYLHGS